jgi:hypothetical protein
MTKVYTYIGTGPYKGMSSLIFGLGSVVFNLSLTNSVHVYRRYITEERDRTQGLGTLIGCCCSLKFNDYNICWS